LEAGASNRVEEMGKLVEKNKEPLIQHILDAIYDIRPSVHANFVQKRDSQESN
jgi:hypothetical protein